MYEVTHPTFDTVVAVKLAGFDWEIQYLENETTAYKWIEGHLGSWDTSPRMVE